MDRNVCCVKIQDNLFGFILEMFDKEINQEILDSLRVPGDAVISISIFRILLKPEFQAVTVNSPGPYISDPVPA
jgi:hypothetical protein